MTQIKSIWVFDLEKSRLETFFFFFELIVFLKSIKALVDREYGLSDFTSRQCLPYTLALKLCFPNFQTISFHKIFLAAYCLNKKEKNYLLG